MFYSEDAQSCKYGCHVLRLSLKGILDVHSEMVKHTYKWQKTKKCSIYCCSHSNQPSTLHTKILLQTYTSPRTLWSANKQTLCGTTTRAQNQSPLHYSLLLKWYSQLSGQPHPSQYLQNHLKKSFFPVLWQEYVESSAYKNIIFSLFLNRLCL